MGYHALSVLLVLMSALLLTPACQDSEHSSKTSDEHMNTPDTQFKVETIEFGTTDEGVAHLYTLTNANGVSATFTNYGAILVKLLVPDANGNFTDVVLGYDSLDHYLNDQSYFGATVGRYANRIGNATFELDGQKYELSANDGPNNLHSGPRGFSKYLWDAKQVEGKDFMGLAFSRTSPDMEAGFPGNLDVTLTYKLNNKNELTLEYRATTDKVTVLNFTHHSYFNLAGEGSPTILDHELMVNSAAITEAAEGLIPTGQLLDITDTPFDFRTPTVIGGRIESNHPQMVAGHGYDHNYVLGNNGQLAEVARLRHPESGRIVSVSTTEPGLQVYTGNWLDGVTPGKNGRPYQRRSGICLETQHYPDSPNHAEFPTTVLRPGETFNSVTIYKFSTD